MYRRTSMVFPLVLLAILALITFWIEHTVSEPTPKPSGKNRHDPDYYLENFVSTKTDINGNLKYVLAATQMQHYPDNDSTDLTRPKFTQYGENKPYTQMESQHGHVSSKGDMVEMVDKVKVVRQAFEGRGEMVIHTEYLKIFPKQEIASTEDEVLITQAPATVIHATGMYYDKNVQTVTLHRRVKIHYEKPKP
jgi:lipopolysaccharide export system protein LptC